MNASLSSSYYLNLNADEAKGRRLMLGETFHARHFSHLDVCHCPVPNLFWNKWGGSPCWQNWIWPSDHYIRWFSEGNKEHTDWKTCLPTATYLWKQRATKVLSRQLTITTHYKSPSIISTLDAWLHWLKHDNYWFLFSSVFPNTVSNKRLSTVSPTFCCFRLTDNPIRQRWQTSRGSLFNIFIPDQMH